ncbi:hypothetical protein [Frigidibacter oleivorans]|uniref:hypothetical protein n=1 Tax=Frigidibacter oleivorans TaxID=2487129 RepID=UPI000F8DDE6C|nr:hypothetical protein [Frigidibacter oleivorans]
MKTVHSFALLAGMAASGIALPAAAAPDALQPGIATNGNITFEVIPQPVTVSPRPKARAEVAVAAPRTLAPAVTVQRVAQPAATAPLARVATRSFRMPWMIGAYQ